MTKSRRAGLLAAVFSAGCAAFTIVSVAHGETLADAASVTYETNPTLQAQRSSQRALDETYVQAQSGLGPTVSASASISTSNNTPESPLAPNPINASSVALTVAQPLYTGGRTAANMSAAEADVLAGREGLRRVEQTVLQSVIQSYVDVRRDQQRLAISNDNVSVLERQLREARARFQVGEITRTDVAQAEARLAAAQASRSAAQAQLSISRAAYAAVVGQNPGTLAAEPPLASLLPASIDDAFTLAERNNPQMRQADYTEQGSAARVAATRALTRPSVSARLSVGVAGGGPDGASPFADYSTQISGSLAASVPIFTGGLTTSQIRAATERNNVDRIGIETARRQVLQQVSIAWSQLLSARAQLVSTEQQVRAATIAFEGTRQEAQVGLRTTLDVLNAEQELRNAQLALVNAKHDEYVASAAVLAAIGALDIGAIVPNAPRYDPAANFDDVRRGNGYLPWQPALESLDRAGAPKIQVRPAPTPAPPVAEADPNAPQATATP